MTTAETASRSAADRIARQVLRVEGVEPRALMSLRGSLVVSAVRCVLTYALIPALTPFVGWLGVVATPVSLVLSLAAGALAIISLRRVWLADWSGRWLYTAFIAVVLVFVAIVVAFDLRALLA